MEFEAWVALVRPPDPHDPTGALPAGADALLRELFDSRGPVGAAAVETAWRGWEDAVAGPAMVAVAGDIEQTTRLGRLTFHLVDDAGSRGTGTVWRRIACGSERSSVSWGALSEVAARLEVADFAQDIVVEELNTGWPMCPTHDRGLHPRLREARAVWWCTSGVHKSASVGTLGVDGGVS